jgi:hypothetical protein
MREILSRPEKDEAKAEKLLRQAIKLHEDHMAGRAPVTGPDGEKSQMRMMEMMRSALVAMTGRRAE